MDLYSEFFSIIAEFKGENIKYAVVGGIAMAFHDIPRFTRDIDILALPEDIPRISNILSGLGYRESSEPWTFKKTKLTLYRFVKIKGREHMLVDVLAGEESRYKKIILKAIKAESKKGPVSIAARKDLIWMKRIRNSAQDKADIRRLKKNDKD